MKYRFFVRLGRKGATVAFQLIAGVSLTIATLLRVLGGNYRLISILKDNGIGVNACETQRIEKYV